MKTTTLVQASADIVTVVSLKPGDVYKRLEKDYSNHYELHFGVVQDVLSNGEDTAITAVEFGPSYSGVTTALKTFAGDSDLKLFAARPDEVRAHFAEVEEAARRKVNEAEKDLFKARTLADQVSQMVQRTESTGLATAETITVAVTA